MRRAVFIHVLVIGLFLPAVGAAAPIVFEASGANAAAIQGTVDAFRAALGANNLNAPGPLPGGRREINWDGGGSTTTATAPSVFTGFQVTRGALFTTPGSGFAQSPVTETAGPLDQTLGELVGNPTYDTIFTPFSPLRLFTPIASNITDVTFFIPGVLDPAGVSAFGAIFSDVDLATSTTMDFFGAGGNLLLSQAVLPGTTPDNSLSFLGVLFDAGELITRVRITTGTTALGPNDDPAGGVDIVTMDDFIYSEPTAVPGAVPEPASLAIFGVGMAVAAAARRRRSR